MEAVAQKRKTAREAATKPPREYLIVTNLHHSTVSFFHPETGKDVVVPPYWSVSLVNPQEWEDAPDLDRLVTMGLLKTEIGARRIGPPPILPPEHDLQNRNATASAYQIAFMPPITNPLAVSADDLINILPEPATKNLASQNPDIDVRWLKVMHVRILRAAKWLIEHHPNMPPWGKQRLAVINERLRWIEELRE